MSDIEDKLKRESMAEKVALLTIQGVGIKEIHKRMCQEDDLTLSRSQVIALKRHPRFHEVMKREVEAVVESAQNETKMGFAVLVPEANAILKEMIQDKHIGAITLVYKGIGMLDQKPEQKEQTQSLTVILPDTNMNEAPVIEVNNEDQSKRSFATKKS